MKQRPKMMSAIKTRCAVTFIELLIVITIIGVLVGVSIPKFRNAISDFQLENFAKDIYYLSRHIQTSSATQEKVFYLGFNFDNESRSLQAFSVTAEGQLDRAPGRFGELYRLPRDISVSSQEPPEKKGIYFYPDFSIDSVTLCFQGRSEKKVCLVTEGQNIALKNQ